MKEISLKKPVIALMIMSAIGVAAPIAVGAYYSYNDYVSLMPQHVAASITLALPSNTPEPVVAPEAPSEATPKANKKIERILEVPEMIIIVGPNKATQPVPKKLVCSTPRQLIQGSGTVRACDWQ
jgi:hypothetical protein